MTSNSTSCFICNCYLDSKKNPKRHRSKENASTNSISPTPDSSNVLQAIYKLWELPVDICVGSEEGSCMNLVFCPACSKKVRRVCKTLQQLETVRQVLHKMKIEIEEIIKSSLVNIDIVNLNIFEKNQGWNFLRNQIVLKSNSRSGKKSTFTNPIVMIHTKSEDVGQHYQKVVKVVPDAVGLEDLHWRETLLSMAGESCEEIDCDSLNEPTSIDIPGEENNMSTLTSEVATGSFSKEKDNRDDEGSIYVPLHSETEAECPSDRLKCSKCRYTFKDELGRDAHFKKLHEGCDYPYFCPNCDKKFKTRRQLQIHVMGHNKEFPFICENCGQGYRTKQLLCFHLKNKHHGSREFKCNHCEKSFSTKSKLQIHDDNMHSKEYSINCSTCGKGFSSKTSLNIHMVKHVEMSPWQCPTCEKYFSCSSALKTHIPSHTRKYKFKCSVCNSGGPSQSALDRHMLSHGTVKGFECNICSKTFKVHAGEKNFQCSLCGKTFIDKYKLVRHSKIHEGDSQKPFECQQCQKRFYTKYYLSSHMKFHEKQAAKEQEALSALKKAKRAKKRKRREKKVLEGSFNLEAVLPEAITEQEIITSFGNVETGNRNPILPSVASPDIFSGVFEFAYQDI